MLLEVSALEEKSRDAEAEYKSRSTSQLLVAYLRGDAQRE